MKREVVPARAQANAVVVRRIRGFVDAASTVGDSRVAAARHVSALAPLRSDHPINLPTHVAEPWVCIGARHGVGGADHDADDHSISVGA